MKFCAPLMEFCAPSAKFLSFSTLVMTALMAGSMNASALMMNLVTNGDFSANAAAFTTFPGTFGAGSNPAAPTGFTISGAGGNEGVNGSGTGVGNVFGPSDASAATDFLYLSGNATANNTPGAGNNATQTLTLAPHTTYNISFDIAQRNGNLFSQGAVTVLDNAGTLYNLTLDGNNGTAFPSTTAFQLETGTFTTGASAAGATLVLESYQTGDNTVDFANLSITVPEPSTTCIGGLGIVILLFSARRASVKA